MTFTQAVQNTIISQIVEPIQAVMVALGERGEKLRLARSKAIVFESTTHSKDFKSFSGKVVGRDGVVHNPSITIDEDGNRSFTCTCRDHQNLVEGTRKKGKETGDNFADSPCKHNLALGRKVWIYMQRLRKVEVSVDTSKIS